MTLTTQLATLIQDYLSTAAAAAAGIPDWPIQRQDDGSTLAHPSIVVRADERTGSRLRICIVIVSIHCAPEPGDTTAQLAAEAALTAVNALLYDEAALYAHIAAADIDLRTGWSLHYLAHPTPDDVRRDEQAATTALHAALQLGIQVLAL